MFNPEKTAGISTACFYPMPLEDAFDIVCGGLKYNVCELFLNTQSETEIKYLKNIKSKAADNNIRISAVHPYLSGYEHFLFFTEYKRRTLDSISLYKMFFESARFLGADFVIFHGLAGRELKMPVEEYAGIFLLINREAKKYGVELLHENIGTVNNYIREIINISPEIRFTLDFKHAVTRGFDVCDIIDAMGKNIAHIHLNDMYIDDKCENISKTEMCRLPFFGNLNYLKIFKKLKDINYIGDYITEVYRYNYTEYSEIAESKNRFEKFLERLEK
ncbi:MAG: sugar phosphate isomerase/epimerase [Oscillospiraceae bacterium]|nr:sugar phosphate isomerase/epimerase [Oscillospiraceae bacterium]